VQWTRPQRGEQGAPYEAELGDPTATKMAVMGVRHHDRWDLEGVEKLMKLIDALERRRMTCTRHERNFEALRGDGTAVKQRAPPLTSARGAGLA